jgi:hypothetical protein
MTHWPLGDVWLVLLTSVVAIRLGYWRFTTVDRHVNGFLVLLLLQGTLLAPPIRHALSDAVAFQLVVAVGILERAPMSLFAAHWLGRDARPSVAYLVAILCAAATVLLGTPARTHGITTFDYTGATMAAYWSVYSLPVVVSATVGLRACVPALRNRPDRLEIALYGAICAILVAHLGYSCVIFVNAMLLASGRRTALAAGLGASYTDVVLGFGLVLIVPGAVPLVARGVERLKLDRWSRRRRQLLPLWRDLTAACPEIVHLAPAGVTDHQTRYLLHRTIVEIRDCIVILSRYATPIPTAVNAAITATKGHGEMLTYAAKIAFAAAAKTRGDSMSGATLTRQSTADDLLDETDELTRLALVWPRAKTIVGKHLQAEVGTVG